MADWIVRTYHKKNVEQHEYFYQREGKGRIIVKDGFRWATFRVTTTDDNFPEFEFEEVPGGNGDCDSLNLFSVMGPNIEESEMISMDDGGCWGDIEIEGLNEEEEEAIREFIEEEGTWALEDEGEWYLDDTECWFGDQLKLSTSTTKKFVKLSLPTKMVM